MSDSSKDVHKLLKELESKLTEMPMHIYIMIWSISEMAERMKINENTPKFIEICYPFTSVPIFLSDEAKNLEDLWRKNIKGNPDLFPEPPKQSGGSFSLSKFKKGAIKAGKELDVVLKGVDPKLISPDYLYDYTTELFDTVDSKLTEASGNFGVIALENTMPDPNIIIPTMPPLILPVSAKSVFPMINAVLESLRILNSVIFYVDPMGIGQISRNLLTIIMVCLDLARGNMYHAIFTSFGFIGNNPMYIGIILKILRDAIMLVSPDLRTDLRDILFKSSKSFVTGFSIWLFTTMSPQFVRAPVGLLFARVSDMIDSINNSLNISEEKIKRTPIGRIATITLPRIPDDRIPDVNNLYALREALREPVIYCDEKISKLIEELRGVPPFALFFDLALIPRKDGKEYPELCAPYTGGDLTDNLLKQIEPVIELKSISEPKTQTAETPSVETPSAETPSAETPSVEIPQVKLPNVQIPKVEIPTLEIPNPMNLAKKAINKKIQNTTRNTLKNIRPMGISNRHLNIIPLST
jgi:hypothetical protein